MKNIFTLTVMILVSNTFFAQVGINTVTPGNGAILDVTSSDKGVLLPRVALTSTIVDLPVDEPDMGVLIFNTAATGSGDTAVSPGYYWWNDTLDEWQRFTSGEQGNHYEGELYGGGVVFYVFENGNHGLIASLDDLNGGVITTWGPDYTDTASESWWDGETNTNTAISNGPVATDAVKLCYGYVSPDSTSDWHLPSIGELKALEDAAYVLFKILDSDGDSSTNAPDYSQQYWSSTTSGNDKAYLFKFTNTHTEIKDRDGNGDKSMVRAVRAF
ncbi:MAG: DUF1566 domain-containing protein [Flavobacteriaceae bacterium]|nr:DUF1566 domain-containing protein [Flavobacteriaceae bacterium]